MPTHEYIRDERFRALGLAYWRSTFPTDTPGWAEGPQIKAMLDSLPYDVPWVAHNALFDASVLQERFRKPYQRRPKLWLDTMLMSRYCIGKAILPRALGRGAPRSPGTSGTKPTAAPPEPWPPGVTR